MKNDKIISSAKILYNAKLNAKKLLDLNNEFKPQNINDAYKIQEELKINYLTLKNNRCIGKKVGCTNKDAQDQVGIHEPFYGNLFSKFSSLNNCELKSINFSEPYVEPEISFLIKNDIDISKAPYSIKDSKDLFEGIVCSIEIVDFRFKKKINEIGIENLIASNGASDFWIRGNTIYKLDAINLLDNPVLLYLNNDLIENGNTNNVLGNPINSAVWLINKICKSDQILLKGQFISTGSCTKAIKLEPNKKVKAVFENLETIEFKYN
tara:strand:+ start:529 stop:1326 length:798 start_codon:yes stop_codon:yes gene_type:complete